MKKFNWKESEEFKQINHYYKFLDLDTPLGLFTVSWDERVVPTKYGAEGENVWIGWFDTLKAAKKGVIEYITNINKELTSFLHYEN